MAILRYLTFLLWQLAVLRTKRNTAITTFLNIVMAVLFAKYANFPYASCCLTPMRASTTFTT